MEPAAPSLEHLQQLDAARQTATKLRRCVSVAQWDGWSMAVIAAISLVFSLTSPSGVLLGLGMGFVAWRELSSAALLKQLDVRAPRQLATNQLVLSGMLILYFAWSLYQSITGPSESQQLAQTDPELAGSLGNFDQLGRSIEIVVYTGLIIGSIVFQGGMAWYYSSRAKMLESYISATPQWIIDYQRGGGTL